MHIKGVDVHAGRHVRCMSKVVDVLDGRHMCCISKVVDVHAGRHTCCMSNMLMCMPEDTCVACQTC